MARGRLFVFSLPGGLNPYGMVANANSNSMPKVSGRGMVKDEISDLLVSTGGGEKEARN